MRHRFADVALVQLIAAGQYYERQIPGLGEEFITEVERGIAAINLGVQASASR